MTAQVPTYLEKLHLEDRPCKIVLYDLEYVGFVVQGNSWEQWYAPGTGIYQCETAEEAADKLTRLRVFKQNV